MTALVPLADRVDSLVAVGRRGEARAVLARIDAPDVETRATALARAAELAREDGDLDGARRSL